MTPINYTCVYNSALDKFLATSYKIGSGTESGFTWCDGDDWVETRSHDNSIAMDNPITTITTTICLLYTTHYYDAVFIQQLRMASAAMGDEMFNWSLVHFINDGVERARCFDFRNPIRFDEGMAAFRELL